MSIVERTPAPPGAAAPTERLRVITAGRVGNMEARLGTSGFDVVAIADTEEDLIIALAADDPDAIVVEADLCESLEHVRDLAPDAVLIVVGDRTPAGALGRIESGVSGTVMAGLLHALVAEGVAGAAVWGLVPALSPPAPMPAAHAAASAFATKLEPVRRFVSEAVHEHAGLIATAGTIVVTASAALLLTFGAPHPFQHPARPRVNIPVAQVVPSGPIVPAVGTTSDGNRRATTSVQAATPNVRSGPEGHAPSAGGSHHASPSDDGLPGENEPVPPVDGTTSVGAVEPAPPVDDTAPPTSDASRPPGVAHGWDGQRPPKNDDPGKHAGWTKGHGADEAPPQATEPPGQAETHGQATEPPGQAETHGQATEPPGQAETHGQATELPAQAKAPDHATGPVQATEPPGPVEGPAEATEPPGPAEEQADEATQ